MTPTSTRRWLRTIPWVLVGVAALGGLAASVVWGARDALFLDLLGRPPRPHEILRLERYVGGAGNLVWLSGMAALATRAWQHWRARPGPLRKRAGRRKWPWITAAVVAAIAVLRVVDPYEWYIGSFFAFAVIYGVSSYLLGAGLLRTRLGGNRDEAGEEKARFTTIERLVLGAALLCVIPSFWVSIGLDVRWVLPPLAAMICLAGWSLARPEKPRRHDRGMAARRNCGAALPLIVNLAWLFLLYAYMLAPPGTDVTGQAQIAAWLKGGATMGDVRPYLDSTRFLIKYPTGLSALAAAVSFGLDVQLNFVLLWLWALSLLLLTLAVYDLLLPLLKRALVAGAGTLLFIGPETLRHVNAGGASELFALAFAAMLAKHLLVARLDVRAGAIAGIFLSGSVLTQTQVAFPFLIYLPAMAALLALNLVQPRRREARKEFLGLLTSLATAFVLFAPWALRLLGKDVAGGFAGNYLWSYSLWSATFWGTKGGLFALAALAGTIVWWMSRRRHAPLFLLGLCGVALSQYHRLYPLLGVSWYGFEPAPNHPAPATYGVTHVFRDEWFPFISQQGVVLLTFTIVLGILAAYAARGAWVLFVRVGLKARVAAWIVVAGALLVSIGYRLEVPVAASLVHDFDYRALVWLRDHTSADSTFILNPSIDVPGTNALYGTLWAGAISERRVVLSYTHDHEVHVVAGRMIRRLPAVVELSAESLRSYMADHCMTHVFVSSRHTAEVRAWVERIAADGFDTVYARDRATVLAPRRDAPDPTRLCTEG